MSADAIIAIFVIVGIVMLSLAMVITFIFQIIMMVHVFRNDALTSTAKWIWFCLMLGLFIYYGLPGLIVSIVYFFTDRKKKRNVVYFCKIKF